MVDRDKPGERSDLVVSLGMLLGALDVLVRKSPYPVLSDYQVASALFHSDLIRWRVEATRFVSFEGGRFEDELDEIFRGVSRIQAELGQIRRDDGMPLNQKQERLKNVLATERINIVDAINRVPISWMSRLTTERTPFATHYLIRDAILSARQRVHYFDRYLRTSFFDLYLRDLPRHVEVRLVTTKGNGEYGVDAVRSISQLAGQEFARYCLFEVLPTELHDRNLRVDDRIFALGASVSDAGRYPTNFSNGDGSPHGHSVLDAILAKGRAI